MVDSYILCVHALSLLLIASLCVSNVKASLIQIEHRAQANGPVRFIAFGDWGRKGLYNQSAVARTMGKIGWKLGIDFIVSTGDNFYPDGLTGVNDSAFAYSFSRIYTARSLQKPWYNVMKGGTVKGHMLLEQVMYFNRPAKKNKFNWQGVLPRNKYILTLKMDLKTALKESNATWKIVVGHHPMRSIGHRGDTTELKQHILPILEANKVPIYINGHDHCLQHINNTGFPIEFLTSGGGSKAWKNQPNYGRYKKNLKFFYDGQGFISVQLTRQKADVDYYNIYGKNLHSFMLIKRYES